MGPLTAHASTSITTSANVAGLPANRDVPFAIRVKKVGGVRRRMPERQFRGRYRSRLELRAEQAEEVLPGFLVHRPRGPLVVGDAPGLLQVGLEIDELARGELP